MRGVHHHASSLPRTETYRIGNATGAFAQPLHAVDLAIGEQEEMFTP